MRRISFLALIVGGAVSFFSSIILSIPVGAIFAMKMAAAHRLADPNAARAFAIGDPLYYYGVLTAEFLCCMAGGFLAGVTARHDEALNGLLSALFMVAIEAGFAAMDPHPLPVKILRAFGYLAASALGGYLRAVQVRRRVSATVVATTQ